MNAQDCIALVMTRDPYIQMPLCEILEALRFRSASFGTAAEYLAAPKPDLPACLILDLDLPDTNGLDFQKQIGERGHPPIIFITGHGDIRASVRAIKLGAIDFLTKPLREADLISALHAAIAQDRKLRSERAARTELRQRLSALTPREGEVLPLVVSGLLNKQAAALLGISQITLQIHRSRVMQKMKADSLADLVRMADKLQIPVAHCRRNKMLEECGAAP